jgi:5S rRNA maturation endonuclease (ribonuclease M5)
MSDYPKEDPGAVLQAAGIQVRRSGGQYIGACPFCQKKDHFYCNAAEGLWDCKACGKAGNLYQLKQELGMLSLRPAYTAPPVEPEPEPEPIENSRIQGGVKRLLADADVCEYLLQQRGFGEPVIKGMSLILEEWKGARWIGFPWRVGKEWRGIKYRIFPPDLREGLHRFRRLKGYKSVLYNGDVLDFQKEGQPLRSVILASGETDAISLMTMGYRSVVASTTGENSMPIGHMEQLRKMETVYVLFDSDKTGREAAEKVSKKIGIDIAKVVRLPDDVKDANEFLVKHGKQAKAKMDGLIKGSAKAEIPTIKHVTDLIEDLKAGFFGSSEPIEAHTPWAVVNDRMARFNGLVVLSAPQNVGKTTFGLQICDFWAEQNKPALFYCLEMGADELVAKVIMARYQKDIHQLKANDGGVIERFGEDYAERPFYLGYAPKFKDVSAVLDLMQEAIHRFDLKILFFDNVHVLGRGEKARYIIGELSIGLKNLAMENNITVVAIAQPRKIELGKIMNRWDVKESVDLLSDADNMIILHRQQVTSPKDTELYDREDHEKPLLSPYTLVRIEKTRFGSQKDAILYLEGAQHRFRELYQGEQVEYKGKRGAWRQAKGWSDGDDDAPAWVTEN